MEGLGKIAILIAVCKVIGCLSEARYVTSLGAIALGNILIGVLSRIGGISLLVLVVLGLLGWRDRGLVAAIGCLV